MIACHGGTDAEPAWCLDLWLREIPCALCPRCWYVFWQAMTAN